MPTLHTTSPPAPNPGFILLYVENPPASAAFYADLLGREPIEVSPRFAMMSTSSGLMLGLWSRHTVQSAATAGGGGAEIGLTVDDATAVDATHADWASRGIAILQAPLQMDFGRTFVALDPDGHRLRVFAPNQDSAQHSGES